MESKAVGKLLLKAMLSEDVPKISVKDAHAAKDHVVFLDTRGKEEFNVSHIREAVFAGYETFNFSALKDLPKNQRIITYCSIGKRSNDIAKKLRDAGYTRVQNMVGGIFEWMNNGYPVVDILNKETNKVHSYNRMWGAWLEKGEKVYKR